MSANLYRSTPNKFLAALLKIADVHSLLYALLEVVFHANFDSFLTDTAIYITRAPCIGVGWAGGRGVGWVGGRGVGWVGGRGWGGGCGRGVGGVRGCWGGWVGGGGVSVWEGWVGWGGWAAEKNLKTWQACWLICQEGKGQNEKNAR